MTPDDYRAWLSGRESLRECGLTALRAGSELEWQARWYAGDFGWDFTTAAGEHVRVVQPGVWNREAGPDFAEAAVSIDGAPAERGAIELDLEVRDWERHGHAENPAYEGVLLHLFFHCGEAEFFSRTANHRQVRQVQLSLESVRGEALPDGLLAKPGRCVAPLAALPEAQVRAVLEAAAQHRWQQKARRLARLEEAHGTDEALYQALAETLGYKSNKLAFRLLAQRVPLKLARSAEGEALLFGVSGFLPTEVAALASETRIYVREIWERWWQRRAEFERLQVPRGVWKLTGHRPLNHPQRRVAALAMMARKWTRLRPLVERGEAKSLTQFFAELQHDFWRQHYTLNSVESAQELALVGAERVTQMLANVIYPRRLAQAPDEWDAFRALPAASKNRRALTAATRLFGAEVPADWLKREVWQQGLLQIYEDFCLQDASDCAACLFPRQLARI